MQTASLGEPQGSREVLGPKDPEKGLGKHKGNYHLYQNLYSEKKRTSSLFFGPWLLFPISISYFSKGIQISNVLSHYRLQYNLWLWKSSHISSVQLHDGLNRTGKLVWESPSITILWWNTASLLPRPACPLTCVSQGPDKVSLRPLCRLFCR